MAWQWSSLNWLANKNIFDIYFSWYGEDCHKANFYIACGIKDFGVSCFWCNHLNFSQVVWVFILAIPLNMFFSACYWLVCVCVVIDEGKFEGAVFLNLAKSFDCVNREILLQKFTCYSIQGDACRAFCMADFSWSVGEWWQLVFLL